MSDDVMVPVTPEMGGHFPTLYHWHGDGRIEPGDSVHAGVLDMCSVEKCWREDDCQVYVEVDCTSWSDYSGATYTRSNCRSLLRDFPDTFVHLSGMYGWEVLLLEVGQEIPEHLGECFEELKDYPVYDESDESDLRMELEQEDWESWGRGDLRREIGDEIRRLTPDLDYDLDDEDEEWSDDKIDALMHEAQESGECFWEPETAVGGYWYGYRDMARRVAAEHLAAIGADWEQYARSLIPTQPEVLFAV